MMRTIVRTMILATAIGVAWACTSPTEMCACPPSRSSVALVGTLLDARGAVVPNTVFAFEATPDGLPTFGAMATDVRTDAFGNFAARVYSVLAPRTHSISARIVRTVERDTVRIPVGSAPFKGANQTPDTLRRVLQLP